MRLARPPKRPSQTIQPHNLLRCTIKIQASRILLAMFVLIHICASISILLSSLFLPLQLLIVISLLIHFAYCWQRWKSFSNYRFQYREPDWYVFDENDSEKKLVVEGYHYWSRWLVVLKVCASDQSRQYFCVVFDSCNQQEFHHLRVITKAILPSQKVK